MRFAQADSVRKAGRPRWWVAGFVLCLVAGIGAFLLADRPEHARLPAPDRSADTGAAAREDAASQLLARLTATLEHGSRRQAVALATTGDASAGRQLGAIYDNVRALGITDLAMRYVDEQAGRLTPTAQRRLGGDAWVGDVQLRWRIKGYDAADSHLETTLTFSRTAHGAAFASARGGYGDATPLWLLGRLHVRRSPRSLVMTTRQADLARFAGLADQAVVDVRKVLHDWRGRLVVEVPADEHQLDRVLGAHQNTYDEIAAVTTTVDGTLTRSAPTHIFVNPPVFDPLGAKGSQIVMSHEATHVATHAATASMPTWLLEGFADYVALDHVPLPVSVTASQILAQVRRHGVPRHLPGKVEFDTGNTALGASYEAAWLACRLIGEKYGEATMIAFYRRSARDSSTDRAFHALLGTDQKAFTRQWQQYLRRLAG